MSTQNNRVKKPRVTNFKSSDRRLAAGIRPESFLLSQQHQNVNISPAIQKHQPIIKGTKTKNNKNKKNHNTDPTLDEWDPAHFRLFVGNLGSDANDIILLKSFGIYPSVTKVKVPMDKNGANKGYGFVAFSDPNDYLKAFKELNGKYIGHNPCVLKKANDLKKKK